MSGYSPFRERGFTLLEILVVVFIIGVLSTVVASRFRFNQVEDVMEKEIRRFELLSRSAWEQAMIEGRSVGVEIADDGYTFYLYDPQQLRWITLENDRLLRSRRLPEAVEFELRLDDVEVKLPLAEEDEDSDEDDEPPIRPQILYLASGEITPYSIIARSDLTDSEVELVVDLLGRSTRTLHDRRY